VSAATLTLEQLRIHAKELGYVVAKKTPIQFSKIHVAIADLMVLVVWLSWCFLQFMDKSPPPDLAMLIVSTYGVIATGGYYAQNVMRDLSLNNHGIHVPEPGTKRYIPPAECADIVENTGI
jgi:hypothetical protein